MNLKRYTKKHLNNSRFNKNLTYHHDNGNKNQNKKIKNANAE